MVHSHLYSLKYAAIVAMLARVRVVVHTVHNIAQKEMGAKDRRFNRILYHLRKVTPVALSKEIQSTIMNEYKLRSESVPIVFNGIYLEGNQPKDSYEIKDLLRIIHVGRFQEQKNHRCILEAAKILKDKHLNFEFCLFGDGELLEQTKRYAKEMNLDDCICFMGTSENVIWELKQSDIFVLPSLWEGMPMTIIEAMSVGIPIIAADVGGVSDMVENEKSGLLINTSAEELADSVFRLFDDKSLRERLGKNAYILSAKFTAEKMAYGYVVLYKRLSK